MSYSIPSGHFANPIAGGRCYRTLREQLDPWTQVRKKTIDRFTHKRDLFSHASALIDD
jgi:hypothetical protein